MARLTLKHLNTAWAALAYLDSGDALHEGGDWLDQVEAVEKAKVGIEAEIDRRVARREKRKIKTCSNCKGTGITGDARTAETCCVCKGTGEIKP